VRNPDSDFQEWLKRNPVPSLQELVAKWGTYSNIPAEAWAEFDAARETWEAARKSRLIGA